MKLCKDCKHRSRFWLAPFSGTLDQCKSPQREHHQNPITGKMQYVTTFCETQRTFFVNTCSPAAKWFEPK